MGSKELAEVAKRYWEGQCTEEEEARLREHLLYGQVPQGLEDLADYLRYQESQKHSLSLDDTFDRKVLSSIEASNGRVFQLPTVWKIAAGIALLVGAFFMFRSLQGDGLPGSSQTMAEEFQDTYDDPELAYQEVKKALRMVSGGMNEGSTAMNGLSLFHEAKKEVEQDEIDKK